MCVLRWCVCMLYLCVYHKQSKETRISWRNCRHFELKWRIALCVCFDEIALHSSRSSWFVLCRHIPAWLLKSFYKWFKMVLNCRWQPWSWQIAVLIYFLFNSYNLRNNSLKQRKSTFLLRILNSFKKFPMCVTSQVTFPAEISVTVMHQCIGLCCVYSDVLISVMLAVRKWVKNKVCTKVCDKTFHRPQSCDVTLLMCVPIWFWSGFFTAAHRVVGRLEPNRHIFRPGGEEGAIESRDIIMKCKSEYCFYYKAKQTRLCRDSHQRCLCDD